MKLIFLKSEQRQIQGKDYTKLIIFEEVTGQAFTFYHITDNKVYNFVKECKIGQDVTDRLCFVIKKGQKISFDIK